MTKRERVGAGKLPSMTVKETVRQTATQLKKKRCERQQFTQSPLPCLVHALLYLPPATLCSPSLRALSAALARALAQGYIAGPYVYVRHGYNITGHSIERNPLGTGVGVTTPFGRSRRKYRPYCKLTSPSSLALNLNPFSMEPLTLAPAHP